MLIPLVRLEPVRRPDVMPAPVEICLLGSFQLLKAGKPIIVPSGSKLEVLLTYLGLRAGQCIPRELLVQALWPNADDGLASQSLRSLLHTLHRLFGDAIDGVPLIVHADGCYQLNTDVGVAIDVAQFDALVQRGNQQYQAGDPAAEATYRQAMALYRGDLQGGTLTSGR